MRGIDIPTVRSLLLTRDDLALSGQSAQGIERALEAGELHRLRRGWYMPMPEWAALWPEARHLAHVVAVHTDARARPVFAFTSAAAVLGMPIYRVRVDRVHTIHPDAARRSHDRVVRHRASLENEDVVEVDGILCTSAERTAFDLARLASPEVALVCADAIVGRLGGDPRRYDEGAAAGWIDAFAHRVEANAAARGIRLARALIGVIDGRSQLPLESVTKLQLRRIGFSQPRLQIRVAAPSRGSYWADMAIDEADAFYECDGETKYTDEAMRSGRSLEAVLLAEKQREDWIRGTTGRRVLRGGSAHAATPAALAARLRSFGVALPDRRTRLIVPTLPLTYGQ